MPLLNFLERKRRLFWSVNNYPNLTLHEIADAERNLGFYGYSSPEFAYSKGKDYVFFFFAQNKGSTLCKATSQEMHQKGAKHFSPMPIFLQIH